MINFSAYHPTLILSTLIILFLCACSEERAEITVREVQIREPVTGQTVGAAFFEVTNTTNNEIFLIGASTPLAQRAEIHQHVHNNGRMRMEQLDKVRLPPGESVTFRPGHLHLMLFGVDLSGYDPKDNNKKDDEKTAPLTLQFSGGYALTVEAKIHSVIK